LIARIKERKGKKIDKNQRERMTGRKKISTDTVKLTLTNTQAEIQILLMKKKKKEKLIKKSL